MPNLEIMRGLHDHASLLRPWIHYLVRRLQHLGGTDADLLAEKGGDCRSDEDQDFGRDLVVRLRLSLRRGTIRDGWLGSASGYRSPRQFGDARFQLRDRMGKTAQTEFELIARMVACLFQRVLRSQIRNQEARDDQRHDSHDIGDIRFCHNAHL